MRLQSGSRRLLIVVVLVLTALGLVAANSGVDPRAQAREPTLQATMAAPTAAAPRNTLKSAKRKIAARKWNVVVILTDDQPKGMLDAMPKLRALGKTGVTFDNAVIPTSICCPSRSSLLTGMLSGRHGVYSNGGPHGGYPKLVQSGFDKRTFPVWLQKAGYKTGYFGKYMNNTSKIYDGFKFPGWNKFQLWERSEVNKGADPHVQFRVTTPYNRSDRKRIQKGKRPKADRYKEVTGFETTYFAKKTANFIRKSKKSKPFAAVYAPWAPHTPHTPEDKYRGTLPEHDLTENPAIANPDMDNKPEWVRSLQETDGFRVSHTAGHTAQREQLRSVDDGIGRIMSALKASGQAKRTLVVFTSDNGLAHGEHGLSGKYTPYRAATDVPLILKFGNVDLGGKSDKRVVAANIDVTATILESAGLRNRTQGKSLVNHRRKGVPLSGARRDVRPAYCGWRTSDSAYISWASGEEEYYNYRNDPYEMDNIVGEVDRSLLKSVRKKSKKFCRPRPPGWSG